VSVAFWNLVGAGLFGFMINPPIALYYMQGLNTTPLHAHAALFGVYGMLGIGLMLFSLRALDPVTPWKEGLIAFGFWATNIGLLAMVMLSLLPVGLMQTWASVEHSYWYARSPEFLQTGTIETFRWLRVIGDTIFAAGALALAIFVMSRARSATTINATGFIRLLRVNRDPNMADAAYQRCAIEHSVRATSGDTVTVYEVLASAGRGDSGLTAAVRRCACVPADGSC
jgi:hypothetical protein